MITCIIPFYNEKPRIFNVLNEIIKVKNISKIICVDDGSTDNTSDMIKTNYPKVKLIKLKNNTGKSNAIKQGLKHSITSYVILIDADLNNLIIKEIDYAINIFHSNNLDMLILRRIKTKPIYIKMLRGDLLLSGERIVKKNLLDIFFELNPKRYQIVLLLNKFIMNSKMKTGWISQSAVNTFKYKKSNLVKGIIGDLVMYYDILKGVGLFNYIRQVLFFCRKQIT